MKHALLWLSLIYECRGHILISPLPRVLTSLLFIIMFSLIYMYGMLNFSKNAHIFKTQKIQNIMYSYYLFYCFQLFTVSLFLNYSFSCFIFHLLSFSLSLPDTRDYSIQSKKIDRSSFSLCLSLFLSLFCLFHIKR